MKNFGNDLYSKMIMGCANHLWQNQVITQDTIVRFDPGSSHSLSLRLLNKCTESINLYIKKDEKNSVYIIEVKNTKITICLDQFFRVSTSGKISTLDGFTGLKPTHKATESLNSPPNTVSQPTNGLKKLAVKIIDLQPQISKIIRWFHTTLFPEPAHDLSMSEGVTFYLKKIDDKSIKLVCYDSGGIYDDFLNAEGICYPPQVAGNYYADAYSMCVFGKLYLLSGDPKWRDARSLSEKFLKRVYPQYRPAGLVWHHSDFKNAAILEELIENSFEFEWESDLFFEDRYEPTNVYALRYHWQTLHQHHYNSDKFKKSAEAALQVIEKDQTLQGLIHDNIDTYPDAHDLTYHQYTCACLGLAALKSDSPKCWNIFDKAVLFTLSVLGPEGEPAFTGRASNNIHQSASAILAFHICAERYMHSNPELTGKLLRGAKLIAERMAQYQLSSGMLPTAMNPFHTKRVGWNHCETPYNALTSYFLIRSVSLSQHIHHSSQYNSLIPLEDNGLMVANDSGYATISQDRLYLVLFGGCDMSYGWSEMQHTTGCGGAALFGKLGTSNIHPSIDLKVPENIAVTDLPIINNINAFGRADLSKSTKNDKSVIYQHSYGGANVKRLYTLIDGALIIVNLVNTFEKSIYIEGIQAWPVLNNKNYKLSKLNSKQYSFDQLFFKVDTIIGAKLSGAKISRTVSNPKGSANRISFGSEHVSGTHISVLTVAHEEKSLNADLDFSENFLKIQSNSTILGKLDLSELF